MLRYYLSAQDMHERISSAHVDYSEMAEQLKNTDLIFRIRRLLEMQGSGMPQHCHPAQQQTLRIQQTPRPRHEGCRQSLGHFAETHADNANLPTISAACFDNLSSVDYQLRATAKTCVLAENDNTDTRIAASKTPIWFRNIGRNRHP